MKALKGTRLKEFVVLLLLLAAEVAGGQVGYAPSRSPYLDLGPSQELTLLSGLFIAQHDAAGVAPQTGLLTGLQYEWRAYGPFHLAAEFSSISSKRTIIDATTTDTSARNLGTKPWQLFEADGSMAMALTGGRSWHHLVPMITLGGGVISDFRGRDTSGFTFGTRFVFTWGAGIRWTPGGRFQLRADVTDHMYSIDYPESYYVAPAIGIKPFLDSAVAKSRWRNNPSLTLGLTYFY